MEKIVDFRIGLSTTTDIDDGKQLGGAYYVIYALYEDGDVWYETEKDTLEEARRYVEKRRWGQL